MKQQQNAIHAGRKSLGEEAMVAERGARRTTKQAHANVGASMSALWISRARDVELHESIGAKELLNGSFTAWCSGSDTDTAGSVEAVDHHRQGTGTLRTRPRSGDS